MNIGLGLGEESVLHGSAKTRLTFEICVLSLGLEKYSM